MVLQEALVDLLDDREQPHIGRVQPQLGVGVPRGRDSRRREQAPGQRLPHLRGVVVHGLEIDLGHAGQPVTLAVGLQVGLPGPLWRPQRPVAAVDQRERRSLVERSAVAPRRDVPPIPGIGRPQRQPGSVRGHNWVLQRLVGPNSVRRPAGDMQHVHRLLEELVLGYRHHIHPSAVPVSIEGGSVRGGQCRASHHLFRPSRKIAVVVVRRGSCASCRRLARCNRTV